MRPPRVLTRSFPLMTVPYTAGAPCSYWTLTCLAVSSALHSLMGFLFVSPVVCSRLPSDSTSRWTPLPFSYPFPTAGQGRDFHPIERAPAGRTKKRQWLHTTTTFSIYSTYYTYFYSNSSIEKGYEVYRRYICVTNSS